MLSERGIGVAVIESKCGWPDADLLGSVER
jgi:hypothetical protein